MAKTKHSDITLSMRELDRLKIVQAVLDGLLKPGRAAERLKLTDRQFRRLVQRYRLEGAHGLLSKHRERRSAWVVSDRFSYPLGEFFRGSLEHFLVVLRGAIP